MMLARLTLVAALIAAPEIADAGGIDAAPDVSVKAAFLYNFVKFVEWPALSPGAPIVACFIGNNGVGVVFADIVRGKNIGGHALEATQPQTSAAWHSCNVLFIPDAETALSTAGLDAIKTMPVLTVSDGNGFAQAGGIIELYVEGGRMRFAINVDAAERSGLHISSRLLGLARVVRNPRGQ
jgi:hypothetical protein